ncbi:hypothetical protein [Nocardia sp. MW-W600-9]
MSAPATSTAGPAIRSSGGRRVVGSAAGWALVVLATAVAFRRIWQTSGVLVDSGYAGFSGVLLVLLGMAALGIALRRAPEVPRDRVTDVVLGLAGLTAAAGLLGLLTVRLGEQYVPLRLDLLAAWMFVISATVLVFGVRPAVRCWPVWALLLALLPPVYGTWVTLLGGDERVAGGVLVVLAACAVAMVVRGLAAVGAPGGRSGSPEADDVRTASVERSALIGMPGAGVVLVAAVALACIPLPGDQAAGFTTVAGVVAGERVTAPGWNAVDGREFPWIPRYFGPGSVGGRQVLEADEVDPDWDVAGRKRRVAMDVISAGNADSIGRYPEFALYRLAEPRFGPPSYFDLGAGIVGRMRTVVDDRTALRWTWLSWDWRGVGGAERVTMIAATDHLPTAAFPEPDGSPVRSASTLLRQVVRGQPVDGGPAVLADSDLLLTLAHLVVAVRTGAR